MGDAETLLSIGMIGPIILAIVISTTNTWGRRRSNSWFYRPRDDKFDVNGGLLFTILGMILIGLKAHTKDPGL